MTTYSLFRRRNLGTISRASIDWFPLIVIRLAVAGPELRVPLYRKVIFFFARIDRSSGLIIRRFFDTQTHCGVKRTIIQRWNVFLSRMKSIIPAIVMDFLLPVTRNTAWSQFCVYLNLIAPWGATRSYSEETWIEWTPRNTFSNSYLRLYRLILEDLTIQCFSFYIKQHLLWKSFDFTNIFFPRNVKNGANGI